MNHGVVKALLLGAAAMSVALGRIDQSLASIQEQGSAAGGIGNLANPTTAFMPGYPAEIARAWNTEFAMTAGVESLTFWYLCLDVVLRVITTALLGAWLIAVSKSPPARGGRWPLGLLIAGYIVADAVETFVATQCWRAIATAAEHGGPQIVLLRTIGFSSLAKWLFVGLVVASLLIVSARLHFKTAGALRDRPFGLLLDQVLRYRAQVLVVGVLTAVFLLLSSDLGRQVDDVLVRSAEEQSPAFIATFLAALTSIVVTKTCEQCGRAYEAAPTPTPVPDGWRFGRILVIVALAGGLLVAGALVPETWRGATFSIAALPLTLLLWLALSGLVEPLRDGRLRSLDAAMTGVLRPLLSFAPLALLVLAIVRAVATRITEKPSPELWGWLALTLVTLVIVEVILQARQDEQVSSGPSGTNRSVTRVRPVSARQQRDEAIKEAATPLIVGVILLVAIPFVGTRWTPLWPFLGTPSVLFLWALCTTLVLAGLVLMADAYALSGAAAFGVLSRWPVLSLLLVWSFIASAADLRAVYFDVRLRPHEPAVTATQTSLRDAYQAWLETAATPAGPTPSTTKVVPLTFVAAAGGGIRAAYWTAISWSCAFEGDCTGNAAGGRDVSDQVFLASGVSGGSLGLASVRSHQIAGTRLEWAREALEADFVSSALGAFLFRDLPNSVLRIHGVWPDRAGALELAWEESDAGLKDPFLQVATARRPHLVFNSTSTEDACRLVVSSIDFGAGNCEKDPNPGSGSTSDAARLVRDVGSYLCAFGDTDPRQINLSTAALISARFPYVSPAGGLSTCEEDEANRDRTFALDGGIIDNSGAAAVEQAWQQLAPDVEDTNRSRSEGNVCVIPRLLVIDNGYAARATAPPGKRPVQGTAPLAAVLGTYGARSDRELASAIDTISVAAMKAAATCRSAHKATPWIGLSVAVIHPSVSPGTQAPLGWTLSSASIDSMREQLKQGGNPASVQRVRCWHTTGSGC